MFERCTGTCKTTFFLTLQLLLSKIFSCAFRSERDNPAAEGFCSAVVST